MPPRPFLDSHHISDDILLALRKAGVSLDPQCASDALLIRAEGGTGWALRIEVSQDRIEMLVSNPRGVIEAGRRGRV